MTRRNCDNEDNDERNGNNDGKDIATDKFDNDNNNDGDCNYSNDKIMMSMISTKTLYHLMTA